MAEIGYYNYYNNENEYSSDSAINKYQKNVVNFKNKKANQILNEINDSEDSDYQLRNIKENLSLWAGFVRSQYNTANEVKKFLAQKYFGADDVKNSEKFNNPEKYAMYENDLNAVLDGSFENINPLDPRIDYTIEQWDNYNSEQNELKASPISFSLDNLLTENEIDLDDDENILISFNPYTFKAEIKGCDIVLANKISNLINTNDNSKNLMYHVVKSSSNLDEESVAKFKAYHQLREYTGYSLQDCILDGSEYYTKDGKNLDELLKKGIENSSIGPDFRESTFNNVKKLLDTISKHNSPNEIEDLNLTVGYSKTNGFYSVGNVWEA